MTENGNGQKSNIWREVADQVSDHVDLAALEMRYESQQALKRLVAFALIFMLLLTGFIVLQVSLIGYLMKFGLSMGSSGLILAACYGVMSWAIYFLLGRRDKRAGPPFSGTQKELRQTIQWIQRILS